MGMKLVAVVLLLLPAVATAQGFVVRKAQWDEMNDWAKDAYVAGYLDGLATPFVGSEAQTSFVDDVFRCIFDLKMTTQSVVVVVNSEYETLENWDKGPYAVILSGLRKVCLGKINDYRRERGEPALAP
jgi:hypothetical protein